MATQTITGTNGKFEVTVTDNKIEIKYIGDKTKITCKKIVFVQTIQPMVDGTAVKPLSTLKNFPDWVKGKHLDDDQLANGCVIDHLFCEKDPYYNGDDPQDIGSSGDTTTDKPSTMDDTPYFPDSDLPNAGSVGEMKFETCAYCVDNKTFLDCITWTYKRTKGDAGKGTITVGGACAAASQTIKDALDKFNTTHTDAGKAVCPEEKAAVDTKKVTPGGSKTVVIGAGTEINVWDIRVDPPTLVNVSTSLDRQQQDLTIWLNTIQESVDYLATIEDMAEVERIAAELQGKLAGTNMVNTQIAQSAFTLRTEGIQAQNDVVRFGNLELGDDATFYRNHQVKLTYLGGQSKPYPTLIFNSFMQPLDMETFEQFERAGIAYGNDDLNSWSFTVKPDDIKRFVETVNGNPGLSNSEFIPPEPYFSVMIVKGTGDDADGFESIVDELNSPALVSAVLSSIDVANVFGMELATRWSRIVEPTLGP